jgi:dihydrofolate reductase
MGKLVVTEFVSLDGAMEAPGGEPGYAHTGWVGPMFSDELGMYKFQEQSDADIMVLGRLTYESFYGAWSLRDGPMAEKISTMPTFVASTTMASAAWDTAEVLPNPVVDAVAALKARDDSTMLVRGSRTLVHALLAAGLVDELHLQVFPLILGSGRRLYPDTENTTRLSLVSSQSMPHGVLVQTYAPVV